MKVVELYGKVRYAVQIEGMSRREAARLFGIDPRTVAKMLSFSVPPGYRRSHPPKRPKLDPFTGVIDRILEEDRERPRKQRRHRQVEDPLGWRSRGGRISGPDDDAPRPALCRLSLPRRAHQLCGLAVFPVPIELAH